MNAILAQSTVAMRLALSEAMEIAVQPLAQMVEDFGKSMRMYDGDWAMFCPCCELWLRDFSQYLHHVKLDRHRRRSEVIRTRQEIRRLRRAQRPAKATSPPLQPLAGNLVQGELAAMEAAFAISEAFGAARSSAIGETFISRRLVPPQELAAMKAALATGEATRAARSSAIGETFIAGQESASATGEASEAARSSAIDEKVIVCWPNWPTERRRRKNKVQEDSDEAPEKEHQELRLQMHIARTRRCAAAGAATGAVPQGDTGVHERRLNAKPREWLFRGLFNAQHDLVG